MTPTFEDVDKHIQAANLASIQPPTAAIAGLPNICPAYKIIRPILVLLSTAPLIPAKWQAAIKAFLGVMDAICP